MMATLSRIVASFALSFVVHVLLVAPLSHLELLLIPQKRLERNVKEVKQSTADESQAQIASVA